MLSIAGAQELAVPFERVNCKPQYDARMEAKVVNHAKTGKPQLLVTKKNGLGYGELGSPLIRVEPEKPYKVTAFFHTTAWNYGAFVTLKVYEYSEPNKKAPEHSHESPAEFAVVLPCRPDERIPRYCAFTTAKETKAIAIVLVVQGNPVDLALQVLKLEMGRAEGRSAAPPPEDPLLEREAMLSHLEKRPNVETWTKRDKNRINLLLNGQAVPPIIHETYTPDVPYSLFAKAGVVFQVVPVVIGPYAWGEKGRNIQPGIWVGPNKYNFEKTDQLFERVLRAAPDACLVPALLIAPYPAWGERYPDEVAQNEKGEKAVVRYCHYYASRNEIINKEKEYYGHSLFSEIFRVETREAIAAWLEHLKTTPYYKAVAGFVLAGGQDGQWGNWGYAANAGDYSPAGKKAFQRWLREEYGTVDALRNAWGRADINFENASIPTIQERVGNGAFLDPVKERPAIDYFKFDSDEKCRTLVNLAEGIKQAAGKKVFCMSYYEDAFYGRRNNLWFERRRRRDPALDIFVSPLDYGPFRRPGWVGGISGCISSLRFHKKLFLNELDLRTETSGGDTDDYDYNIVGRLDTARDFNSVNRREVGLMAAYGMSVWYYSLANGFHSPYAIAGVKEAVEISNWAIKHNTNRFQPEVAIFADEEAGAHVGLYAADQIHFPSTSRERSAIFLSGVPVDIYAIDDLMEKKLPNYKVYVFLNSYALTETQRAFIDRQLKQKGKTLVWMYAAGYSDMKTLSAENMSRLVGMTMRKAEGEPQPMATISVPNGEQHFQDLLPSQGGDLPPGSADKFFVDDDQVAALGRYVTGNETAIALKRFPSWTSVYIGRPGGLGPDMLHAIAKDTGAYTLLSRHGNCAATNGNLLMLYGVAGGKTQVRLPFKATVEDLINKKTVAENVETLELEIPVQDTILLGLTKAPP
ncbi:MAG: beta-galactosidase [Verrucomicrobia bacterium]|nr:beta-galactosidase [Verrucomicrobiota bacterium]